MTDNAAQKGTLLNQSNGKVTARLGGLSREVYWHNDLLIL